VKRILLVSVCTLLFTCQIFCSPSKKEIIQWLKDYTEKYFSSETVSTALSIDETTLSMTLTRYQKLGSKWAVSCMLADIDISRCSVSDFLGGTVQLLTSRDDKRIIKEIINNNGNVENRDSYYIAIYYGNMEIANRAYNAWRDLIAIAKQQSPY